MRPSTFLLFALLLSCSHPKKEAQEPTKALAEEKEAPQRESSVKEQKKNTESANLSETKPQESAAGDPLAASPGNSVVTASSPDLVDGKAEVTGGLDQDTVRRVIRRAMNQIKFCYEQALTTNPSLGGKMKVYFVVSPNGSVTESTIKQSLSKEVDDCVSRKISQLSFPAATSGEKTEVSYPFTFQSAQP